MGHENLEQKKVRETLKDDFDGEKIGFKVESLCSSCPKNISIQYFWFIWISSCGVDY